MTKYAEVVGGTVVSISAYPEAHRVAVDDTVFYGFTDNGDGTFSAPPTADPTSEEVIDERNRRLALGFSYDFGDARGAHTFATTESDMSGWQEVTTGAQAAINLGQGSNVFSVQTETGPVDVTADEWQMILAAITVQRQAIWSASFTLQAMNPIPSDYDNDSYWP